MTARQRLPNRRSHEVFEFEHEGFRYRAGFGRFPDGRLGEIFLSAAKTGTTIESIAQDAAIICSVALQHGADPETLRCALGRRRNGEPAGPLTAALDIISSLAGGAA